MHISAHGKNLIVEFEGFSSKAYKADENEKYYTIGYGHYGKDVKPNDTITKDHALEVLDLDLARFEKGVLAVLQTHNIKVNQNQFDALVCFAFNIGVEAFSTSTLIQKLANGDIKGAADEFLRWNRCGPNVLTGLTRRRKAERNLFLS